MDRHTIIEDEYLEHILRLIPGTRAWPGWVDQPSNLIQHLSSTFVWALTKIHANGGDSWVAIGV